MILSTHIKININSSNKKYYEKLGYVSIYGEELIVSIKHLNLGSHDRIEAICDVCGKITNPEYRRYNKSVNCGGYYSCCTKCSTNKRNLTNLKKYGHINPFGNVDIQKKIKETNLYKYEVEHPLQNEKILEKILENTEQVVILIANILS